jgi:hypothetical protein
MFLIYTNIIKKINKMIKKFFEFKNDSDTEVIPSKPKVEPKVKPEPPPFTNPYEDDEDDEDDDLEIKDPKVTQPKLKKEDLVISKLKDVLNEKGMTLEDLYKLCLDIKK